MKLNFSPRAHTLSRTIPFAMTNAKHRWLRAVIVCALTNICIVNVTNSNARIDNKLTEQHCPDRTDCEQSMKNKHIQNGLTCYEVTAKNKSCFSACGISVHIFYHSVLKYRLSLLIWCRAHAYPSFAFSIGCVYAKSRSKQIRQVFIARKRVTYLYLIKRNLKSNKWIVPFVGNDARCHAVSCEIRCGWCARMLTHRNDIYRNERTHRVWYGLE